MVEIKNVVNRMIDGIVKFIYWCQVQQQLAVCGLKVCHFFETRIKEFKNVEEFYRAQKAEDKPQYLGVMLLFLDATLQRHQYQYMPLDVSLDEDTVNEWIASMQDRLRVQGGWRLFQSIYWYLDEMSCVIIDRNPMWFEAVKPHLDETWATILRERVEGYEHRAPNKRSSPDVGQVSRSRAATATLAQLFASMNVEEEECI